MTDVRDRGYPWAGWLAVLVAWPMLTTGCGHKEEASSKATDAQTENRPVVVTVSPLSRRTVERRVEIEGTLRAWDQVTVSAKKGGRVLKVHHDMGDKLKPGTPLVELDPVDTNLALQQAEAKFLSELSKLGLTRDQAIAFVNKYGINEQIYNAEDVAKYIDALPGVQQARAKLEKAKLDYARQENMHRRNAGTLQDLQNTENEVKQCEAAVDNTVLTAKTGIAAALSSWVALKIAQQDRADMIITAPEPSSTPPGTDDKSTLTYAITKRMIHEGQRIKDGDALFEMVIDNPIRLWANVPERYRGLVPPDAIVRLKAQSHPDETFEGRVTRINPSVDATSRTFQVEALVSNTEGMLPPGGFVKGEIITARSEEAVVVPIQSIYSFAGVTKVFLVENGKARGYSVTVGRQYGPEIEVIATDEPLPKDGMVVDTGQSVLAKLAEGSPVTVREPGTGDPGKPTVDTPNAHNASAAGANPEAHKTTAP